MSHTQYINGKTHKYNTADDTNAVVPDNVLITVGYLQQNQINTVFVRQGLLLFEQYS